MAEPRRLLGLAGWGLALGLLFALWRWPDRLLALRHLGQEPLAPQGCDLAAAPCTATFPDGLQVTLQTSPPGLPASAPLTWTVTLSDPAATAQHVELTGISMPMGLTRIPLVGTAPGAAEGQGGLPACTVARMQWRAEVTLDHPQGARIAAFEFWSTRGVDAATLPAVQGWDGHTPPGHGELLVDTAAGPLALSDLRGKAVVVYFGYTACPDICPTTLSTMGAAFRLLSEAEQQRVAGLMISLDPERDSLERLAVYAGHFHPAIQGGTAAPEDLAAMAADWGASWRVVPLSGSGLGYALDHSTDAYLVGPDGRYVAPIPHGTPPDALAALLRAQLSPAPQQESNANPPVNPG